MGNLRNLFFHFFRLKRESLLSKISMGFIIIIRFQIILKCIRINIVMFENMTNNFSLFAFLIMSALDFRKIFLEVWAVWPLPHYLIVFIIWSVLTVISYSTYAYIWILNFFCLNEFIGIIVKELIRWVVIFFDRNLTLLHHCIIGSILWIIWINIILFIGSIFQWLSLFKDSLIFGIGI